MRIFSGMFFIVLFALQSCGSDKKENKNPADQKDDSLSLVFFCHYNENKDSTFVSAIFRKIRKEKNDNGIEISMAPNAVELEDGSSISFNDSVLRCNKHSAYSCTFKGLITGALVKYKDGKGGGFSEWIEAPGKITFPAISTLNKNFEIAFSFGGRARKKNEDIKLSFVVNEYGHEKQLLTETEGNLIKCPVNQTYTDGPAVLSLTRQYRSGNIDNGRIRSRFSSSYTTRYLPVTIVSRPEQTDPPQLLEGSNPY
ncbi:MAG TPA: hypothetical protein VF868_07025 [Bacteroidia bacterium]|jgi:hypothetical protein